MSVIFISRDKITASAKVIPIFVLRPDDWDAQKERLTKVQLSYAVAQKFSGSVGQTLLLPCLLYTSPSPRDRQKSRMPSSA